MSDIAQIATQSCRLLRDVIVATLILDAKLTPHARIRLLRHHSWALGVSVKLGGSFR